MAQLTIGVGTVANDGTGDTDRAAWIKVNTNFTDLYRLTVQAGKAPAINGSVTITGTDSTTITFPSVSATLPGLAIANVFTASQTVTSAGAAALAIGLNGATNPAFVIDASTASRAAGLKVTGAATGGTVAVVAIDSGSNTNLTINAKGSGTIGIGSVSTGAVTITPATTFVANVISTKDTTSAANQGAFSSGTIPYNALGNFASFNAASATWTQLIVSNSTNGAGSSANIVVSNNAGTDTAKYGCIGINSDTFSGTACSGDLPTATYVTCATGDLAIGTITANAVHLFAGYAVTDAITISSANVPSLFNANLMSAATTTGQLCQVKSLTEITTIAAAAYTDTGIQIPAGAIVLGVTVRVTAAVTCTSTLTVGVAGSTAAFSTAAVAKTLNAVDKGTKAGAFYSATLQSVRITPDTTPSDNTGRVRVTIHYLELTAPTS
jgi:hypothetical protein